MVSQLPRLDVTDIADVCLSSDRCLTHSPPPLQNASEVPALQSHAELYRSIAKNFPNGAVLLFDRNLRYLIAEGVELETVKLSSAQMEGKTLHEVFAPDVCEFFEPLYRAALAGESNVSQYLYKVPDSGERRCYSVHTLPVTGERGEVTGGMVMTQNITAWYQAQETLRNQAERERLLAGMQERIRASLKIQDILSTAVTELRQFLETDRVLFYKYEPERFGVVVESTAPGYPQILGTELEDTCFVDDYIPMYRQGGIQVFEDLRTSGIKRCQIELLDRFQVKASLVVPVLQGDRLWGLLFVHHCRSTRQWQTANIEMLQQLSTQLAIALHQAELYQQLEAELVERRAIEQALRQSEMQLQKRSRELEATVRQLESTQAQLVQSEKMSSLGQLVAGVAHEINNPVSFISGNISYADRYATDLLELVQLYQQHPQPTAAIEAKIAEMDLEFIQADLPRLLASMRVGADRIQEIIRSLRNFSRLDEAEVKEVDIHEGLDNTLLILRNRLRTAAELPAIEVIKAYGDLPLVECYAGQLNQVFMNILSNAIDALDERDRQRTLTDIQQSSSAIRIRTEQLDANRIRISIADNGLGMSEQVRQHLFDPFFTTKTVGKGTGLGMSISYRVITEGHGGSLYCTSAPGKGAEFAIEIPIRQTHRSAAQAPDPTCNVSVSSVSRPS